MSLNANHGVESAESPLQKVHKENHQDFLAMLLPDTERIDSPELVQRHAKLQKEQLRIQAHAKRAGLMLNLPLNPDAKQQGLHQFMGRLTNNNQPISGGNKEAFRRYGAINIGRWKHIYTPQRLQKLRDVAEDAHDADDTVIDAITHNTDGRGYGLQLPLDTDPESFSDSVQENRYMRIDRNMGIVRPNIEQIEADLAALRDLPLNKQAAPFIEFLQELRSVDVEYQYTHDYIPKVREMHENPNVEQAKGAGRVLALLALLGAGAVSLIMERNKNFPIVSAFYLGAATLVWNPKIFSENKDTHLAKSLHFTAPPPGSQDKWAELMEGPLASDFTGESGVQIFDFLLEPTVQTLSKKVQNQNISTDEYFAALREEGDEEIVVKLEKLFATQPGSFFYLMKNVPNVRSMDAKDLLISYAREGMTMAKLTQQISETSPIISLPKAKKPVQVPLGGIG